MYLNLKAEMARHDISRADIAKVCDVTTDAISAWTSGETEVKLSSALKIKEKFFPELSLEYLFEFTSKES